MPENQSDDRQVKAADVKVGDFTYDSKDGAPVEVTHVQPFVRRQTDYVLIVTADGDTFEHPADDTIHLAGTDVLAEARARRERKRSIADIREFADWLDEHPDAPVPQSLHMQHSLFGPWEQQLATAERIAGALGAEVVVKTRPGDERLCLNVEVRVGRTKYVVYGSRDEAEAAPATPDDGREDLIERIGVAADLAAEEDAQRSQYQCKPDCTGGPHDGHVYACCGKVGRISAHESWCKGEPKHRMAGGWKGDEPGSCGAECACGVTYDGFDSLNAAVEFVERHVAEANAPLVDNVRRETEDGDPQAPPVDHDGYAPTEPARNGADDGFADRLALDYPLPSRGDGLPRNPHGGVDLAALDAMPALNDETGGA